ncbi:hypothetical protein IKA15_00640 [bacterium]|nr:hypothetical protein [bacterium]
MTRVRDFRVNNEVISAMKVQELLDASMTEILTLCEKTNLKPKQDEFGNLYFTKADVEILKKVKNLFGTKKVQPAREKTFMSEETSALLKNQRNLIQAKKQVQAEISEVNRKQQIIPQTSRPVASQGTALAKIENGLARVEENIISKMNALLSEKMDGLDEVIMELIRAKTENESLREKINNLNKENYALKSEVNSYKPFALGLYVKNNNQEF